MGKRCAEGMVFWIFIFVFFICFFLISIFGKRTTLASAREAADEIQAKNSNSSKEEYLKKIYALITKQFAAEHLCWLKYPWRVLWWGDLWNTKNIPCNVQNRLLQECLLKRFNKEEIKTRWIVLPRQAVIHCYSLVQLRGRWIPVDPWGAHQGIPFGQDMITVRYKR